MGQSYCELCFPPCSEVVKARTLSGKGWGFLAALGRWPYSGGKKEYGTMAEEYGHNPRLSPVANIVD